MVESSLVELAIPDCPRCTDCSVYNCNSLATRRFLHCAGCRRFCLVFHVSWSIQRVISDGRFGGDKQRNGISSSGHWAHFCSALLGTSLGFSLQRSFSVYLYRTRKQRLVGEDIGDSAYRSFPSTNHDVVG